MTKDFLIGPKLGDFVHGMYAVKQLCLRDNVKANIHLTDRGCTWELGIETAYQDLYPIISQQDYVESFNIFDDHTKIENYVDIVMFRRSPWLYQACWTEIYSRAFNFTIGEEYSWLKYNKVSDEFKNKVVIFRKNNLERINFAFPYEQIINEYQDNVVFASFSETDYQVFPYNNRVPFKKLHTLEDLFLIINSSELVISNLSSPGAIAQALDKKRIMELSYVIDSAHYMGEEKYSKNALWYLDAQTHNLK